MLSLEEMFCGVDDFCKEHSTARRRGRQPRMCHSEIMTILIWFQQSGYRTFKAYYLREVQTHLRSAFPNLVSYSRFIWLAPRVQVTLEAFQRSRQGRCDGVTLLDSTALSVCDNHRIRQHRVFAGLAQRGKTSMGWFYGFKLHLAVNRQGDILAACCTPGNCDDRQPVPDLVAGLAGKVLADRGYISRALTDVLAQQGIHLVTDQRANMHRPDLDPADKAMLRSRFLIETIFDQLKNDFHLDHTRHRSSDHFRLNLAAALCAYTLQSNKPALRLGA
jgi:transposase